VNGPRKLPEQRTCYRIGDPDGRFPVVSAEGARRADGRWHARGDAVIYAAEHYSTAMLEKLAHWNGVLPANQHPVEITLPAGLSYEMVPIETLAGWSDTSGEVARPFGHEWFIGSRSLLLFVPSVVARMEKSIVINEIHPELNRIKEGLEILVYWDERLYNRD
jgi:RES domain-containing protein